MRGGVGGCIPPQKRAASERAQARCSASSVARRAQPLLVRACIFLFALFVLTGENIARVACGGVWGDVSPRKSAPRASARKRAVCAFLRNALGVGRSCERAQPFGLPRSQNARTARPLTRGLLRGTASLALPMRKTASCVSFVTKILLFLFSLSSIANPVKQSAFLTLLACALVLTGAKHRARSVRGGVGGCIPPQKRAASERAQARCSALKRVARRAQPLPYPSAQRAR